MTLDKNTGIAQGITPEDVTLAESHIGQLIETSEPLVNAQILDGENVTEYVVDGINPSLGVVILTYRTRTFKMNQKADEFGLTQSIPAFCALLRSGTTRVMNGMKVS